LIFGPSQKFPLPSDQNFLQISSFLEIFSFGELISVSRKKGFVIERIGVKSVFSYIGMGKAMAKYKSYDYGQRMMIPVSLEEQLVPGTLEFAMQTLVEDRMDMERFEDRYRNDETGRVAYDPKILLKVVLLGYARGLVFSRKMEQACRENITFMALACGQRPDHSTIAAFVSSMQEEIKVLFRDVLLVCEESGLLGGHFLRWTGASFPRMPPRNGVERSRI
jgi:transposase